MAEYPKSPHSDPHDEETILLTGELDDDAEADGELPELLLARYTIIGKLGEGGMGVVYKAKNVDLDRVCALKVLKPRGVLAIDRQVASFFREARAAAALNHPNVVTIHNVGRAEEAYFIEMECVEGPSLAQLVWDRGALPVYEASRIIREAALALGLAHQEGIVHRDIKPQNIMLAGGDTPKLTDFGLARRSTSGEDLAQPGTVLGTPHFMSPEQCQARECDGRSDVYSLGVTYFYCVTGRFPFQDTNSVAILYQHVYKPCPNPKEVSESLPDSVASVIMTAMAKKPAERHQTCDELVSQLNAILEGRPSVEVILEEALRGTDARYAQTADGYEVVLRLPEGRSQHVRVILGGRDPEGQEIVAVYSKCAPASAVSYEWALRLNSQLPYGALALEEIDGEEALVMLHTHLREGLDPAELRKSVVHIGQSADRLEREFTHADRH